MINVFIGFRPGGILPTRRPARRSPPGPCSGPPRLAAPALERIEERRRALAARYPESLRFVISKQRLAAVDRLHDQVVTRSGTSVGSGIARKIGLWAVHPLFGAPLLLAALYACYQFVGVFGAGTLVDLLEDDVFYARVVPWTEQAIRFLAPAGQVTEFLVGPAGVPFREHGGFIVGRYGLVSMGLSYAVAIVLPIVTTFFIAFSVLEDSGYLPRLAVMLNKAFKAMGLNGKAVIPMVLGLGCDTMATMTARIMETRKERVIVTLLLALAAFSAFSDNLFTSFNVTLWLAALALFTASLWISQPGKASPLKRLGDFFRRDPWLVTVSRWAVLLVVVTGLFGGLGHLFVAQAHRQASAAVLGPCFFSNAKAAMGLPRRRPLAPARHL